MCECSPQAVSQWFGVDPVTGLERTIPNARLLYLKAVRPEVFAGSPVPDARAAEVTTDPAMQAELNKAAQAGLVVLPKRTGGWDGKTERRKLIRRADDRARDAELEAFKTKGA